MAKDIVFVLHGIGQYAPDWIDEESCAVVALREAAKQYVFFEGRTLDSFVEFVPIVYDDVFQRIMEHWKKLADGLNSAIPVMPSFMKETLQLMTGATKSDWARTHGADIALYWGFRLFQQRIVLRVLAQMTRKIADTINQPLQICSVADRAGQGTSCATCGDEISASHQASCRHISNKWRA